MTKRSELLWEQATNDGDYAEAHRLKDERHQDDEAEVPGAIRTQRAILSSAAYWGIDYGSLPDGEA